MSKLLLSFALFLVCALAIPVEHKREYQMGLFESQFTSRSTGIANYMAYLQTFQGNPAYSFSINVTSGYQEIIHEKRYDTSDLKLTALEINVKVKVLIVILR
jgi:hypothetical protein